MEDDSAPLVRVHAPAAGAVLRGGTRARIDWESSAAAGLASHRVQLSLDGGRTYRDLCELPGAAQSCPWTVPSTAAERARIKVVARDSAGNLGLGVSPGSFAIEEGDRQAPTVTLLDPRALRGARGGDVIALRWVSHDNVGVVGQAVQLSLDGGRSYNTLAELSGSASSLQVTLPNLATTLAQLRVVARDAAGNQGEATLEGTFPIEPRLDRALWG